MLVKKKSVYNCLNGPITYIVYNTRISHDAIFGENLVFPTKLVPYYVKCSCKKLSNYKKILEN